MNIKFQSHFNTINETNCNKFQTSPLDYSDLGRVARIITHIWNHFLDDNYQAYYNKGSVTLQNPNDNHKVITVFVDYKNQFADKNNISIHENPIVVCIEITHLEPIIRKSVRDYLRGSSRYYCDPENGYSKWALLPNTDHVFDVLFLPRGQCELPLNEELYIKIQQNLNKAFDKKMENVELIIKN